MASPKLLAGRHSQRSAFYTVTTITRNRQPWLRDPALAEIVREGIATCEREGRVTSEAWVLMPDHVHWLFQLEGGALADAMQAFKSRTARAIRVRVGGSGAIWQAGYYDHRLRGDGDLLHQARYLVSNPVRAGLVARLDDHPHWWARHIAGIADL